MHAIEVRALTKTYQDPVAVEETSLSVRAGEAFVALACLRTNLVTQASILLLDRVSGLGIETSGVQYFVNLRTN